MAELPESKKSFWIASTESPNYPALTEDISVDVAVVGAGIAGLTAAYLLKQSGLTVAVVEKDTVGEGVSGNTTGKITSQHNVIYGKLKDRLGEDAARIYGEANQEAIEKIKEIINDAGIDCDFRHEDSYVYTTSPETAEKLQTEADIARQLGLLASFVIDSSLPFSIEGAVKFSDQATFHIRKYLLGLAAAVHGNGSFVYERSHVIGIRDGSPCRVKTA